MAGCFLCRSAGILVYCTAQSRNDRTGDSSLAGEAFTGQKSTRISVSKICWPVSSQGKAKLRLRSGLTPDRKRNGEIVSVGVLEEVLRTIGRWTEAETSLARELHWKSVRDCRDAFFQEQLSCSMTH